MSEKKEKKGSTEGKVSKFLSTEIHPKQIPGQIKQFFLNSKEHPLSSILLSMILLVTFVTFLFFSTTAYFVQNGHVEFDTLPPIFSVFSFLQDEEVVIPFTGTVTDVTAERNRIAPRIMVSGGQEGYTGGGMISLSSTDEPAVRIQGYQVEGEAEVDIFKVDEDTLFEYLVHNSEGQQLHKEISTENFEKVATVSHTIRSTSPGDEKLLLPLEDSGIWLLQIRYNDLTETAFVVRSSVGAVVKEAENELVFWGQSYETKRSITDGLITVYNLQDGIHVLSSVELNDEGIAVTPFSEDADIAILQQGEERAVVPVNLQRLNATYSYQPFQENVLSTKLFTFTDRPLYAPGQKIYFKSVLRDDNDGVYSTPSGTAKVKVYSVYSQDNTIFEGEYPISREGTIDGEFVLPDNVKTGSYRLLVSHRENWETSAYFYVEYFKKPEHSIDLSSEQQTVVNGDTISLTVKGAYFSGQPLQDKAIKYTVRSSNMYEYEQSRGVIFSNDQYYRRYAGEIVAEGEVQTNELGEAIINIDAVIPEAHTGKNQMYGIEAVYEDVSGQPSFSAQNVVVYASDFNMYREYTDYQRTYTDSTFTLPIVVVSHNEENISGVALSASIHRVGYEKTNEISKYGSFIYAEVAQDYPDIQATTDVEGKATFEFIPRELGSYTFTVKGTDNNGKIIQREFSTYVSSLNRPVYKSTNATNMTIDFDAEEYAPDDTADISIYSEIPDRDILLTFDRAYMRDYQVVHMEGNTATVSKTVLTSDMPNIFVSVSSFSDNSFDYSSSNITVSTEEKKLNVEINPQYSDYGPGETVVVDIETTDYEGNPVSADVALWSVDKALYELTGNALGNIHNTFWSKRYNDTASSHSLRGIEVDNGGKGGCFLAGTQVLMADGSTKNIEEVAIGESVLTRKSASDSTLVTAKVAGTHQVESTGYLILNGSIYVTPNHRMWVNGAWKEVGSIQVGDMLTTDENTAEEIQSIEWQLGVETVYNLEIETYHTYFAEGIWVHNDKGDMAPRDTFEDVAYWNPSIQTNTQGKATVYFDLPDNLTTWVFSAVGTTQNTMVGQNTKEIVVSKDVIVRPVLPNILRTNDSLQISSVVQNFTDSEQSFDINLEFDSGEVLSPNYTSYLLKSNETKQVYWDIKPTSSTDAADFTFSAISTADIEVGDTVTESIPVYDFGFEEQAVQTSVGETEFTFELNKDSLADRSEVTLALAPTQLGTLPQAMNYLVQYPYGCVEQTTSRLVPSIIAKKYSNLFADALEDKDIDDILQKGLIRLGQLQGYDGGWGWWWSNDSSNPFISAYVIEYILMAEEAGVEVNADMLSQAKGYFNGDLDGLSIQEKVSRIYAAQLLDLENGKEQITELESLEPDLLALAVMVNVRNRNTNAETNGLNLLLKKAKKQGDTVYWDGNTSERYASKDASTALAIRAIVEAGGDRKIAHQAAEYLKGARNQQYWSNTFGTVQVIRALIDLSVNASGEDVDYIYSVLLDDEKIASGHIVDTDGVIQNIIIPFEAIQSGEHTLKVTKKGEGEIFSTLVFDEYRTNSRIGAESNGLTVKRKYINERDVNEPPAVGDVITVELTVSGLHSENWYAVVEDQLPAGMIPINQKFDNQQYWGDSNNYYNWYGPTGTEITENGAVISIRRIKEGETIYSYKARVISEGTFLVPPARAELMYTPSVNGRTAPETVTTVERVR